MHRFQELKQELAKRDVVLDRFSRDLQLARSSQEQLLALLNREIRVPLEGLLEMTGLYRKPRRSRQIDPRFHSPD